MESFHWDRHFETGLETVDQQHHALVDLINRFGEMLTRLEEVSPAEIETLFNELTAYAQYHFQEEEESMRQFGIDAQYIAAHMKLHRSFMEELDYMHGAAANQRKASERLLKFLTHWLAFHILGTDQSMARQVRAILSGQSATAAFQAEKKLKEGATEPLLAALNGLFSLVSDRNRELVELNRTLEDKVEERTRSLNEANRQLEEVSRTDVLTGLPNRRHAMAQFSKLWSDSTQGNAPLACLMVDADGFKIINDRYGHDAGDEVLRRLSRELREAMRTDDFVCRLGGDEFLIICPNTSLEGCWKAAEDLRAKVAELRVGLDGGGEWRGSVSVGVAARTKTMKAPEDLIKAADEGVYIAKRDGRNRVACAQDKTPNIAGS